MRLLRTITEEDAGILPTKRDRTAIRQAARAVVFDSGGNIALLYVASDNYFKLPGGGVEAGETLEEALHREMREETGCTIEITGEIGTIEEHRDAWGLTQHSHCYLARVVGECTTPYFTEQEVEDGFALEWVTTCEAIALIRDSVPQSYHGRFIQVRDQLFLREALESLGKVEVTDGLLG